MTMPLRIFIGYDAQESVAYHVLAHSILTRASVPVSITPLRSSQLAVYTRPPTPGQSTDFSFTRFLVPYLCGYQGYAVFLDCDMLCLADIADVVKLAIKEQAAVAVCQHDYTPRGEIKFHGHVQKAYPRKNWSSLMVFTNDRCRTLTPDYVNTASAADLHRLAWADDVGALPLEWNVLVGEDNQSPQPPKNIHWTNGGPWWMTYRYADHSDLWRREQALMLDA